MSLVPPSAYKDLISVKQAIQRLSSHLGPSGSPTFQNITITGDSNFSGGEAGNFVLEQVDTLPAGYVGQIVYLKTDNHVYVFS
jgi:uncharacterized protein with LGFP repeats